MVDTPTTDATSSNEGVDGRDIVVLDTCVLLADPDALFAFDDCDVVLPLTVIEELDNHKTRLDDVGRAARQSVRHLERLRVEGGGDLRTPVECGHNSSVRIELNGLRVEELEKLGLPITKNDNRILAAALGLSRLAPVRFVSADVNMRLKAASLGLVAEDWRHVQRRVAEKQGWVDAEVDTTMIDSLYADGRVDYDSTLELAENEFVVMHAGNQSGLARRIGDDIVKLPKRRAWGLEPRSKEQAFALNLLMDDDVQAVALTGPAGTGKTIVTLAAALEQTFERYAKYDRLMILRPVIAVGRQDIGFLPGDMQEKIGPWFEAIVDTMVALGEKTTHEQARRTMDLWVEAGRLVMEPVTFLRGRSLQNTFVIVDEAQNLEPLSAKTILTRIGSGSKVVMLGDVEQIDNPYTSQDVNALSTTLTRLTDHPLFGHVHLTRGERSELAELAAERL
jgi:PhoH-like ATPase